MDEQTLSTKITNTTYLPQFPEGEVLHWNTNPKIRLRFRESAGGSLALIRINLQYSLLVSPSPVMAVGDPGVFLCLCDDRCNLHHAIPAIHRVETMTKKAVHQIALGDRIFECVKVWEMFDVGISSLKGLKLCAKVGIPEKELDSAQLYSQLKLFLKDWDKRTALCHRNERRIAFDEKKNLPFFKDGLFFYWLTKRDDLRLLSNSEKVRQKWLQSIKPCSMEELMNGFK